MDWKQRLSMLKESHTRNQKMPLDTIGSYPAVMDEVLAHWTDVNTALGAPPAPELMLQGAYTRAMFVTDRAAVEGQIIAIEDLENARETGAAQRDILKAAIRTRLGQFRAMLRAVLPGSKYPRAVPPLPAPTSVESKFLAAFDDMHSLWTRINADVSIAGFTPPLVIGGYALATCTTDLAALRTAFTAVTTAENDLDVGRQGRDGLLRPARERMVQYRAAVEATFGPTHPLTLSLPVLFSAAGSTPAAVTLSGAWNSASAAADLAWTASADPDLEEYEVRFSPGPSYDAGTSSVAGNLPPLTLALATDAGLAASADQASFKVFVRLTTGNEAGSNTLTITRP
jgi:hypothetical protein